MRRHAKSRESKVVSVLRCFCVDVEVAWSCLALYVWMENTQAGKRDKANYWFWFLAQYVPTVFWICAMGILNFSNCLSNALHPLVISLWQFDKMCILVFWEIYQQQEKFLKIKRGQFNLILLITFFFWNEP